MERDEIITVYIECFDESEKSNAIEEVHFILQNKYASLRSSQHFRQKIRDKRGESEKIICYDVRGKENDQILIAKLNDSDISFYGVLMREFFMKTINIISPYGNITSNVTGILLDNGSFIEWRDSKKTEILIGNNFTYNLTGNSFHIKIKPFIFKEERLKNFIIKRSYSPSYGFFMNLNIVELNYKGIDGILGRIGNNQFMFYKVVNDGNTNNKKAIVSVNGNLSLSSRNVKSSNCWYLDINDALYPSRINELMSKNP